MGLDGVELIMAVEEAFGIEIRDEEAGQIRTPRQLCAVVAGKVRTGEPSVCLTQRSFYLLRRAFRGTVAVPRSRFRPETPLEQLVPSVRRRRTWLELRDAVGAVAWPKMRLPFPLTIGLTTITVGSWAALSWWLIIGTRMGWIAALFTAGVSSLAMYWATASIRALQTSLAGQTVRTLSEYLATFNQFLLVPESTEWTAERIRLEVRRVIVDQLALRPDFSDDADFVDDLGVD
jgi:acyl carrier protein